MMSSINELSCGAAVGISEAVPLLPAADGGTLVECPGEVLSSSSEAVSSCGGRRIEELSVQPLSRAGVPVALSRASFSTTRACSPAILDPGDLSGVFAFPGVS